MKVTVWVTQRINFSRFNDTEPKYLYSVTKTQNCTSPKIHSDLTEAQVNEMISSGITVNIEPDRH